VTIAAENFVAMLSLRGYLRKAAHRRAGLARSSDHNDKVQMRLAFGDARLDGERQRQMRENKHYNVTCCLLIFLSYLSSSLSCYISHALLDFGFRQLWYIISPAPVQRLSAEHSCFWFHFLRLHSRFAFLRFLTCRSPLSYRPQIRLAAHQNKRHIRVLSSRSLHGGLPGTHQNVHRAASRPRYASSPSNVTKLT
jgi:hypothetical protein